MGQILVEHIGKKTFAETFCNIDFFPTGADPDAYCRQERKPNGKYYHELL